MIVRQSYWDNSYLTYRFQRLQPNDPTRMLIEKYIPYSQKNEEAFEIGCFPGRFLIEIGQKGYTINGCDITPRIEKDLPDWCIRNSCKVGKFENKNYLAFIDKKYDLVASFGFIEHFKNYEEIFLQHCNMVKSRGILIVQYPNFRGLIQKILHKFFDIDNFKNHVVESMNLNKYKKILPSNFEIVYCSYYGNFDFWIDDYKKRNGRIKKILLRIFFKVKKHIMYLPNNSIWSPYAAIIARKKRD